MRGSTYGSNSPRCTFARSLVQARAWRIEEGSANVYGVSWSPPLLPPDSSCKSSRERVFQYYNGIPEMTVFAGSLLRSPGDAVRSSPSCPVMTVLATNSLLACRPSSDSNCLISRTLILLLSFKNCSTVTELDTNLLFSRTSISFMSSLAEAKKTRIRFFATQS